MRLTNVAWNLVGLVVPLLIAALTIPALLHDIGLERFGLLAIAWGMIGFAGVFDLGIGRATTQAVAQLRGTEKLHEAAIVVKTAYSLSSRTGLVGAALLAAVVLVGAPSLLKYSAELNSEVKYAGYILALAIPVQSVSAMFRGVNEAFENFKGISIVRIGIGVANFLGPFVVAQFTTNLVALVMTLLASRLFALLAFYSLASICLDRELPRAEYRSTPDHSSDIKRRILAFGGWVTLSGVVYPVMMHADRFIIGAKVSAQAVSAYVIPYEMVVQTLTLIGAITTVIFPRLAALVASNIDEAMKVFYAWLFYAVGLMTLVSVVGAAAIPYVLPAWLGQNVSEESILVGQILCAGLIPYTVGTMYLALIHAHNRADVTGKAHLFQSPFYLGLLYWAVVRFGPVGAACAWALRAAMDAGILVVWFKRYKNTRHGVPRAAINQSNV